jgi:6-phosphogluconate dehydrogenase (decarboxylating)
MGNFFIIGYGKIGKQIDKLLKFYNPITFDLQSDEAHLHDLGSLSICIANLSDRRFTVLICLPDNAVTRVIENLMSIFKKNDSVTILDFSNAYYKDSEYRADYLNARGFTYLSVPISGGVDLANNSAIFLSGNESVSENIKTTLEKLTQNRAEGVIFCGTVPNSSLVKSIHNCFEYCECWVISEIYATLSSEKKSLEKKFFLALSEINQSSYLSDLLLDLAAQEPIKNRKDTTLTVPSNGSVLSFLKFANDHNLPCLLFASALNARTPLIEKFSPEYPDQTKRFLTEEDFPLFFEALSFVRRVAFLELVCGINLILSGDKRLISELVKCFASRCIIRGSFLHTQSVEFDRHKDTESYLENELSYLMAQLQQIENAKGISPIEDMLVSFKAASLSLKLNSNLQSRFALHYLRYRFGGHNELNVF